MKKVNCLLAALCVAGFVSASLVAQENGHKKTIVTHTGKVVRFDRMDPAVVVVKTDKAEINAQLSPMPFIEENKLVFNPDEEITVKGYETTVDGNKTFVVTELTTKDNRVVKFRGADFNPLWVKAGQNGHAEKIVIHTGKVKTFERMDPAMLVITTDTGEINAELGPMTVIEEHKLAFAPSDQVIIKGYETMRDGKKVFVVNEITTKDKKVVKLRKDKDARRPVAKMGNFEIRDLSGSVTIVDTEDTPDGRLVTVKTDSGERVIALGPGSYLEKNRYTLKPGETITIRGYEVDRSGKRVFLASEIKRGDVVWKFRRADGTVLWE